MKTGSILATSESIDLRILKLEGFYSRGVDWKLKSGDFSRLEELRRKYPEIHFKLVR